MKYLTLTQLRAKLGGRARSSIYMDLEAGRLPKPIKLGGRLYWPEERLDEWLCGPAEKEPRG
jgi:prophage regulatory protein